MGAWCSGQTCGPVKAETAGSNPVAPAQKLLERGVFLFPPIRRKWARPITRLVGLPENVFR